MVKDEVKDTVTSLSDAIESIQLPLNLSKILRHRENDHVACRPLNLEATVMDCLAAAIQLIGSRRESNSPLKAC